MRLWLIRHAAAEPGATDDVRRLSSLGERQAAALGNFLRRSRVQAPDEVWHSPLQRARQTAEKLASAAGWAGPVLSRAHLLPYDDLALIGEELLGQGKSIALVGHQPQLGRLAAWLVTGDSEARIFIMKKAGVLVLENRDLTGEAADEPILSRWQIAWMLPPELTGDV